MEIDERHTTCVSALQTQGWGPHRYSVWIFGLDLGGNLGALFQRKLLFERCRHPSKTMSQAKPSMTCNELESAISGEHDFDFLLQGVIMSKPTIQTQYPQNGGFQSGGPPPPSKSNSHAPPSQAAPQFQGQAAQASQWNHQQGTSETMSRFKFFFCFNFIPSLRWSARCAAAAVAAAEQPAGKQPTAKRESTVVARSGPGPISAKPTAAAKRKSAVMARPGPISAKPDATAEPAVVARSGSESKPNATKSAVAGKSGAGKSAAV